MKGLIQRLNLRKPFWGSTWKGLCPFHEEKTPSFNISERRQIFRCFGCGKGGALDELREELDNLVGI